MRQQCISNIVSYVSFNNFCASKVNAIFSLIEHFKSTLSKALLLTFFCWTLPLICFTQTDSLLVLTDSLTIDSIKTPKEKFTLKGFFKKDYPNPKKAAFLSLLLPGSGQVYNKKWWKAPIVYAALGGVGYVLIESEQDYRFYRDGYLAKVDEDPTTEDIFPNATAQTVKGVRDSFNKRRQQMYMLLGAVWILNAVEAYVDAHLINFDVNEDLTLQLSPTTQSGLGISLQLQKKNPTPKYFWGKP